MTFTTTDTTGRPVWLETFTDDDGHKFVAVRTGDRDCDVVEIAAETLRSVIA